MSSDAKADDAYAKAIRLWREHGGRQHGPHTETLTMPLANFRAFVDALATAILTQEKPHG